jgi:hypothetical protein
MMFGTTAVDRPYTLDLRPITKRKIGGSEKDKNDRNAQRCKRCLLYLGDKSDMCRGRVPFWAKKEDG